MQALPTITQVQFIETVRIKGQTSACDVAKGFIFEEHPRGVVIRWVQNATPMCILVPWTNVRSLTLNEAITPPAAKK